MPKGRRRVPRYAREALSQDREVAEAAKIAEDAAARIHASICETAERHWGHVRRAMGAVLADARQVRVAWEEHRAIAEAIQAGDPITAEAIARRHAERAGRETHRRLMTLEPEAA